MTDTFAVIVTEVYMASDKGLLIKDEISRQIIDVVRELVTLHGAENTTVRDVLRRLNITNRVFYNRFHNIEEILDILYKEMVYTVRQSILAENDNQENFFERVQSIAERTLTFSYKKKKNFSQFVFGADSSLDTNFRWWSNEIQKLISQGKAQGLLRKDLDNESISYSIWCFIRGFNADAIARNLSYEEAIRRFRLGFGTFLEGMKV